MHNQSRLRSARKGAGGRKNSWWNSIPDLTKITALILALSACLGFIVKLPDVVAFFTPTFTPSPSNCIAYVLVASDNNKSVQANTGLTFSFLVDNSHPLSATHMLELQVNAQDVGKIQFKYDLLKKQFEILNVVDPNCEPLPENNLSTKSFWLDNGGEYEFSINKKKYILKLFYNLDESVIEGTFRTQD